MSWCRLVQLARGAACTARAGHDADEVGPIGGIRMDVAVHLVLGHGNAVEGFRREVPAQRLLHLRHAEHAVRARARHGDAHAIRMLGHEHADQGVARGRVAELGVGCLLRGPGTTPG